MPENPEQPVDESPVGPTFRMVFIHALIPIGLGLFVVYRMDQYEALFGGMNVSLPALTSTVLGFSRAAAENVPAFFAIIGILLAGDGLGYYLLRRYAERPWGRLWWWGVLAVEALVLAGVFRTIILPARRIAESLSG